MAKKEDIALYEKEASNKKAEKGLATDAAEKNASGKDGALAAKGSQDEAKDSISEAANTVFRAKVSFKAKMFIAIFVLAAVFLSLFLGRYGLNPIEVIQAAGSYIRKAFICLGLLFTNPDAIPAGGIPMTDPERILWRIRLPRVLLVMLVGAALAVAGASYQGMFKNPLTSPDLLGASAGASLGACLGLLWSWSGPGVQLLAFIGGVAAVGMAMWLNKLVDYDPTLGLVLAGILVSTLFQSGMSIIKLVADGDDKLPEITFWLMGSFSRTRVEDLLVAIPILVGFIILLTQSWKLNVLSFGDEEARAMGINTRHTRFWVILGSTLVTSASVAVAGIIGWIGLVIPHLARAIVGPNYRVLLPTSMLIGAGFLLLVDNLARLLMSIEIPIGILISILGVPFFIFIFKKNMRGWN